MRVGVPLPSPDSWDRTPARFLFLRQQRSAQSSDEIITAFRDGHVMPRSLRRADGYTYAVQEIGYQGIRRGDLVIHSMDGFAGAIGVAEADGKASPVVHAYRPQRDSDPRYYAYLLRVLASQGFVGALAKGIRERSTAFDSETFRGLVLPEPPPTLQRSIADYLDAETARIDALVAAKRRLAEVTQTRFRVLVDELTSKAGPRVPVRRVTSLITSGPRGWGDKVGPFGRPFIRSANLQRDSLTLRNDNLVHVDVEANAEAARSSVRTGDVLVGITGANTGWVGLVPSELAGACVSQHVAILRPAGVSPAWLAYNLFSRQAQEELLAGQYGGTKQQLGLADLAGLAISMADVPQQEATCRHLETARLGTSRVMSAVDRQVALLLEHRQTLITAAVTGELEIPGVAS